MSRRLSRSRVDDDVLFLCCCQFFFSLGGGGGWLRRAELKSINDQIRRQAAATSDPLIVNILNYEFYNVHSDNTTISTFTCNLNVLFECLSAVLSTRYVSTTHKTEWSIETSISFCWLIFFEFWLLTPVRWRDRTWKYYNWLVRTKTE